MVAVMPRMAAVAGGGITDEELERAKAATVSSILMNLESKAIVAEDIGRQILADGERKAPAEFIAEVKALTAADVAAVAAQCLKSNTTLCMVGDLSTRAQVRTAQGDVLSVPSVRTSAREESGDARESATGTRDARGEARARREMSHTRVVTTRSGVSDDADERAIGVGLGTGGGGKTRGSGGV